MTLSERVRPNCEVAPWVIPEIKQLEAEVDRLRAAVERVRALHAPQRFMFCAWCPTCNHEFPCETLRALDSEL